MIIGNSCVSLGKIILFMSQSIPKKMRALMKCCLLMWMFLSSILLPLSASAQATICLEEIDHFSDEEQLVAYQMRVSANPQDSRLQNSLGFCYYRMGDYDMAEEHYVRALNLSPDYSTAYNNLGVIYLKKEQHEISKNYFEKALQYNTGNVKAMYNLGVAYFREGDYFKALRCYLKAKRMNAGYVKKRGDTEKVREEVDEALKKYPQNKVLEKVSAHLND